MRLLGCPGVQSLSLGVLKKPVGRRAPFIFAFLDSTGWHQIACCVVLLSVVLGTLFCLPAAAGQDASPVQGPMPGVKSGSIDDVSAIGTRDIGARGLGNWYSVDSEIRMGRTYAAQVEKSMKFINDPVVNEYVNRIAQNLVKNSDA